MSLSLGTATSKAEMERSLPRTEASIGGVWKAATGDDDIHEECLAHLDQTQAEAAASAGAHSAECAQAAASAGAPASVGESIDDAFKTGFLAGSQCTIASITAKASAKKGGEEALSNSMMEAIQEQLSSTHSLVALWNDTRIESAESARVALVAALEMERSLPSTEASTESKRKAKADALTVAAAEDAAGLSSKCRSSASADEPESKKQKTDEKEDVVILY
jgi:hypothetical protein